MADFPPLAPLPEVPEPPPLLPAITDAEIGAARGYVEASRAASTRRAYDGDWRRFAAWCLDRGAPALPASAALIAVYLSALAEFGKAPPSIGRALAAIAHTHKRAGHTPPHRAPGGQVIAEVLAGIRRSREMPPQRKAPADPEFLHLLLRSIVGDGLPALRDRALLAFGMALAARRSELVALDVADLEWGEQGLRVTIRRSKTDQTAEGAGAASITDGPIFRPLWKGGQRVRNSRLSDHAVARILQARVEAAGLDRQRYGGHSLRAGFVTAAARAGADVWKIQQVSRHRSMQVLSGYVRDARLFDDHAGEPFL